MAKGSQQCACTLALDLKSRYQQPQVALSIGWVAHCVECLEADAAQEAATLVSECVEAELAVVFAKAAASCQG